MYGICVSGDYFENVNQKLQRNELILKDELKLLLHLCQSVDDMVTVKNAIYRYTNAPMHLYRANLLWLGICICQHAVASTA